jgi:hypothetical protein
MKGGNKMKYKKIMFVFFLLFSISLICLFALAQEVGYIQIKCEAEVTVFLDNNFVGNTTSELGGLILQDVPVGSHVIKIVKEGCQPQSVKIDLKENEIYLYEVSLKQKIGALLVETIPIDCIIEIPLLNIDGYHDGNKTEKAWEVSDIPVGSYKINFLALGKKVKYNLRIEEGTKKHLLVNILKNEVKELLPILPTITWDRTYGGSEDDVAYSLIQTTDGDYVVAGRTRSKGAGYNDFWIIKLNEQGNKVWDKTYGGSSTDWANSLVKTTDEGYAVAGFTRSKGAGDWDFWVIKLDKQGNKIWDRTYGGRFDDQAYSLIQTTDGGYAVAGYTDSKGAGGFDFWVIKLDKQGNKIWDRTYGGSADDQAYSLIQTTDGGYAIAGGTEESKGAVFNDFWVIKLDKQGNKIWDRTYGGRFDDQAYSLIQTTDGGYAVAGYTDSKGAGDWDFWVIKLDKRGNKIWDRTYGGSGGDQARSLIQTTDGGYALAGYIESKGAGGLDFWVIKIDKHDFWVIKLDKQGNKIWDRTYGRSVYDEAYSLIQTTDGGYAVAGFTFSKGVVDTDFRIIKLDEQGNLISGESNLDYEAQTETETTYSLEGSLHCPEKGGYPCNSCSSVKGYINHFKGFNVLTTNEDCYVKLIYNNGAYIGNQNNCEVTIKGEKWLGLENESGTELVEEIDKGNFDFARANKFIERTMNFPEDNYEYEFTNDGKEFRLYLSRDREEAFKAVPWKDITVEIKNKETDKVFKYRFQKGIFPQAYSWSNGVANYGQCVWWTSKRWVEEVDAKTLFPFYPPSPEAVNVKTIDSNYQPKEYDVLINYNPGGPPEHYGFVEKVDGDKMYISQFNFIKPGEVYNYIIRTWNGKATNLFYSNNFYNEYYFKYYYRK